MGARRYTEEQFRAALEDAEVNSMADLCRALGLLPRGANYETVRHFGADRGIDVAAALPPRDLRADRGPRRGRRSYTDAQLCDALADSEITGYRGLCERLGLRPNSGTYKRLREHAASIGRPLPMKWSRTGPRPGNRRSLEPYPEAEVRAAAAMCRCKADTIRMLGHEPKGNLTAYRRLDLSIEVFDIDTSHFSPVRSSIVVRQRRLQDMLVRGTAVNSALLRKRLIDVGLKERACEGCRRSRWSDRDIPLELDHIDGDRLNNELTNLRLLCPNCHALTPTYRGRNIGRASRRREDDTSSGSPSRESVGEA